MKILCCSLYALLAAAVPAAAEDRVVPVTVINYSPLPVYATAVTLDEIRCRNHNRWWAGTRDGLARQVLLILKACRRRRDKIPGKKRCGWIAAAELAATMETVDHARGGQPRLGRISGRVRLTAAREAAYRIGLCVADSRFCGF